MYKPSQGRLEDRILRCKSDFTSFLECENRTHAYLHKALEGPYSLLFDMRRDHSLWDEFNERLAERPVRERNNPALFLIKLVGFPSLLEPGRHDKRVQNKAGDYAAHLTFALVANITPGDFVNFTREGGLRRNRPALQAAANPVRESAVSRKAIAGPAVSSVVAASRSTRALFDGGIWLNSSAVGEKLREAIKAAKSEAQQLDLTLHINADYAVVATAKDPQPWRRPYPAAVRQVIDASATEPRPRPGPKTPHA